MRNFWSNFFTLSIVAVLALLFVARSINQQYIGPGPLQQAMVFTVPEGSGMRSIANKLEKEGAIENAWLFSTAGRWTGVDASLKAGEYEIAAGASAKEVLDLITEGKAILHSVTVPEGLTSRQIVAIVNAVEVLTGEIADSPAEGSLAPDTYLVQRGEDRNVVLARMVAAQEKILSDLWATRAPDLPLKTKEEALILASIIEKETGLASERSQVASVFVNRLRKGMMLQSDPTIIYGISGGEPLVDKNGKRRGIYRSEIRKPTPYNTYTIPALPPGPIANPGRASIAATLNPAWTDYLYFVAVCGGPGHGFSKTNAEHNRKVADYRKCEKARRANGG